MDINSQEHIKAIAPEVAKAYQLGKEQKYVHISVFMKDPAADEDHGQEYHYKNE